MKVVTPKYAAFCRDFRRAAAALGKARTDSKWTPKRRDAAHLWVAFCQALLMSPEIKNDAVRFVAYDLLSLAVEGRSEIGGHSLLPTIGRRAQRSWNRAIHVCGSYGIARWTRQQLRDQLDQAYNDCWTLEEWNSQSNFLCLIEQVRCLLDELVDDLESAPSRRKSAMRTSSVRGAPPAPPPRS